MKIFLDCSDAELVRTYYETGLVDGVTTNPSLMLKAGKNPKDVAEDFISKNSIAISKVFEDFDEEDKDTLDQFIKLTECEMHVFRILEKQIELRNKIKFVDFKKKKKIKS